MKPKWLEIAEKEIGVHEVKGGESSRILEYHACTTLHAKEDEVAWCSAFVNWCMMSAGEKFTRSAAARSWLGYGEKLEIPRVGCIVILKRGNSPTSGHVGFFASMVGGGYIKVLGGNQSDQVRYSNFHVDDVLGYRWPVAD